MLTSTWPGWLIVASAGTVVTWVGMVCAWLRARRRWVRPRLDDPLLAVTVLKPMSGLDARLKENLESFARLDAPPGFEVILCLASEADAAYPVARAFVRRDPHRFRLHVGATAGLKNAKVAQLHAAWSDAKNPLIWVSESNVETTQAFYEALVSTWAEANARGRVRTLVHAPLVGVFGEGLGAACDRMHLASFQNCNHELALLVGLHAVVGKTEFFHRDDVDALGGLAAFGDYLGEDYRLGQAFAKYGVVRCIPVATRNVLGTLSLRGWFDRHARWAVMRKTMVGPAFYVLEPQVQLAWPFLFCAAGLIPLPWLGVLTLARVVLDGASFAMQARRFPRLTDLLVVPLKEALLFAAWLQAVFSWHVKWRADRSIELGKDSLVRSLDANPSRLARQKASLRRVLGLS